MSKEGIVKEFLNDKTGYLKSGPAKIQIAIEKKYGKLIDNETIKKIKKEVKKSKSSNSNAVAELRTIAAKLGLDLVDKKTTLESERKLMFLEKKKSRTLTAPSLKDQEGMHVVLGCNHVPFHNKTLHEGIREFLRDFKKDIKGFHLIGDFADLNTLSSHDKGKFTAVPGLTLDKEYKTCNDELDKFDSVLPQDCWKTYLYGNHEDRYNRWMKGMDNAKTPLKSPEDALDLWNRGYQVKTSWSQDFFTLGSHLDIFHGIYFSIHSAKAHMDKLRGSCMYVHTHRTQTYVEGDTASFNIGACADFKSAAFGYASRAMKSQWSNGFAVVMIDSNGRFYTTQVMVDKEGHFYFAGKKY